jgi:hypothetical protein
MRACSRTWRGRLALASLVILAALAFHVVPADASPVGPETVLAGGTSQGLPSFFKITTNGRTVNIGAIALQMSCASGASFAAPDTVGHIHIGPNGNLHSDVNIPPTSLSGGGTYSGTDVMTAFTNRKRSRVVGVWQLSLSYTFTDGTSDHCNSGPVRFADIG